MNQYVIQKTNITSKDIRQIVAIHRKEIGQGFLSSLGDKALELIFSLAAQSQSGILLVAKRGIQGPACGFLLGTQNTGSFYKDFLLKKSISAVIYLLPKLLSIEKIRKVLETLVYPSKSEVQTLPKAELLDIAVSKEYQGTGLAQLLFDEFSDLLGKKGIKEFKITTGQSLRRAQRFYERLGCQKVATIEVHKGQKTFVYTYQIARKKNDSTIHYLRS